MEKKLAKCEIETENQFQRQTQRKTICDTFLQHSDSNTCLCFRKNSKKNLKDNMSSLAARQ